MKVHRADYINKVMQILSFLNDQPQPELNTYACQIVDEIILPMSEKLDNLKPLYEFTNKFATELGMVGEMEINTHMDFAVELMNVLHGVDGGMAGWPGEK